MYRHRAAHAATPLRRTPSLSLTSDPADTIVLRAAAACDHRGLLAAPARLTLRREGRRLTLLDLAEDTGRGGLPRGAAVLELPHGAIMPALVNAHCHLDLTHVGPLPHDPSAGFVAWVDRVRHLRATDPEAIAESVRGGVELSRAGGVAAVGDVDGSVGPRKEPHAARTLHGSPLGGLSYLEFYAFGPRARSGVEAALDVALGADVPCGLSPHAPYSVAASAYLTAAERWPGRLMTHLAESPEEADFIRDGAGEMARFIEGLGLLDDAARRDLAGAEHSLDIVEPALRAAPGRWLVAHVNDCPDRVLDALRATGTSVAYCPRASAYFDAPGRFGPHRYRDLLAAGVNVCLGTDSIINLDTPGRISPLDDARLLARRDGADPRTLLAMLTLHGAAALGLDPARYELSPGSIAGLAAVDIGPARGGETLPAIFHESGPVRWLDCTA